MILRFTPGGHVDWVFGRKGEASHLIVPPDYQTVMARLLGRAGVDVDIPENNNPRWPVPVHRDNSFNQPTDVAWDSNGNSYFSDGYINSRVGKVNARGEWVTSWGSLGSGPGQFDTPHGIAVSPQDEIYVADRGNRRIQVFDPDGTYQREFVVDVPVDMTRGKIVYGRETPNATTGSQAPGAPDALCMTPGPNSILFIGDLYPSRIYKVSLDGEVIGVYGQPGRNLGEFGWIHAIACHPRTSSGWASSSTGACRSSSPKARAAGRSTECARPRCLGLASGAQGRFFEVTPEGDIVWEYWTPYSGTLEGNPVTRNNPYGVFLATKIPPNHPALTGRVLLHVDPQPLPVPPPDSVS